MPLKGASHEFPAKPFLKELGLEHRDAVFKSDQEAALVDLLQEVVKRRSDAKTFVKQSPVAWSASNGVIERENGCLRTPSRRGSARRCPVTMRPWLGFVDFAAVLINRFEVGHDGRTPYERLRVKSLQEVPGGRADGEARRRLVGRGILGVLVVQRRGCRGDRGGRAGDEDCA